MNSKLLTKTILVYLYYKEDPDFWSKVLNEKSRFSNVFIFNTLEQKLDFNDPNIKIFNAENGLEDLNTFIYSQRLKFDNLILLEQNENFEIDLVNIEKHLVKLRNNPFFNVKIFPEKSEVYEFDIEPFVTTEARVFSLKNKDLKEILDKRNFYYKKEFPTLEEELITIKKEDIDSNFEIKKAEILEDSLEKDFFLALANFYKDSNLAEELFYKVINDDSKIYYKEAFILLLKLLYRKMDFNKILDLKNKYKSELEGIDLANLYFAFTFFKLEFYLDTIRFFRKANLNNIDEYLIYNQSDINIKLNLITAKILYFEDKLDCSEKFLEKAKNKSLKYSPEIDLVIAKINFKKANYDKCFELLSAILNYEFLPTYFIKEVKSVFLNILLFIPFKEESLEILKKDIFGKKEEIIRVADTFYMNEDYIESLKLYLLSVEKFGTETSLLFKLGYICSKLRILDQAIYYYEKFLEQEPEHPDALNNLAFIYLNCDNLENAERVYKKILKLNSFSFEANLYLALINVSLRKKKQAEKYLDQAKTINPVSPEVQKLKQIIKAELV